MKEILKVALLSIALVLAPAAALAARPRTPEAALHLRAWKLACAWSKYNCHGVERPEVVYDAHVGEQGAYGITWYGDDKIYLDDDLLGDPYAMIVMVHEYVHYLQDFHGSWGPPFGKTQQCSIEEEAFTVARKVAKAIHGNSYEEAPAWDEIKDAYGC